MAVTAAAIVALYQRRDRDHTRPLVVRLKYQCGRRDKYVVIRRSLLLPMNNAQTKRHRQVANLGLPKSCW